MFQIAGPYPGTPFFFEVIENGWFRPGTVWEQVDMDESTVVKQMRNRETLRQLVRIGARYLVRIGKHH